MAVVVEVREAGAPAPAALAHAGGIGRVLEAAVAPVAVEPVAGGAVAGASVRVVDAGHEPVHVAVQVVVSRGGAHAVLVCDGGAGDVGEARAGVVAQHLARAEVGGQQEVGVAVAVDIREGRREGELAPAARVGERAGADRHDVAHVLVAALAVVPPEIAGRRPQPVPGPVPVGEEEVEIAVRVMIGRSHRKDAAVRPAAEGVRHFREPPAAVVAERLRSRRVDREEVGHAVVVQVDEIAGPVHRCRRDAAVTGHGLEAAAVPAEEAAGLAGAVGDVELGPAVAVHVDKGEAAVLPAPFDGLRIVLFVPAPDAIAEADRLGRVHEAAAGSLRRGRWIAGTGGADSRQQADETGKDRHRYICAVEREHPNPVVPFHASAIRSLGCRASGAEPPRHCPRQGKVWHDRAAGHMKY